MVRLSNWLKISSYCLRNLTDKENFSVGLANESNGAILINVKRKSLPKGKGKEKNNERNEGKEKEK